MIEYDKDKVDEMTLALLYLTSFHEDSGLVRAWKGIDWDTLDRLHEKGYISDPKNKARSIVFTPDSAERSEELFRKYFGTEKQ